MAIPDDILLKPGRLTEAEYDIIKQHPLTGENIIKPIMLFDRERLVIRHHHERWDGRGYPDGLAGEDIPLLSRIIAVADSFDAMTNNRPYRKAMEVETAVEELRKNAGLQFDREVVHCFLTINEKAGHESLQ
ncbi:MAG TPA: HD domain-containing phosphohydrolase [Syntrophales bacterium]|nr:HD domain-containing phosphohydrolase [Syntrophales bacterium]